MSKKKRPAAILVKMKSRDWDALDELTTRSGAPSRSEAMRAAVHRRVKQLRDEELDRLIAREGTEKLLARLAGEETA